jgi:hypothetical protein
MMRKVLAVIALSTAMIAPAHASSDVVLGVLFGAVIGNAIAQNQNQTYPQGRPPVVVGYPQTYPQQPQVVYNQVYIPPRCFQPIFDRYTGQYQRSIPVPCY